MSIFEKYVAPYSKEVVQLLDSDLPPESKMYFIKATMNNTSKLFIKALNLQNRVSDRSVFATKRGLYSIVVTTSLTSLPCRQFYEDLSGFYCYCIFTDKIYRVDVDKNTTIGNYGTGNESIKACNISVSVEEGELLTLADFETEVL